MPTRREGKVMSDTNSAEGRRQLLKALAVGGGAVVVGNSLPESWMKPVIESVVLPAHAQASGGGSGTIYGAGTEGGLRSARDTWDVIHDATTAVVVSTSTSISPGFGIQQSYQPNSCNPGSKYYLYRSFFVFDTSGIEIAPDSASLSIYGYSANTGAAYGLIAVKATGPDLATEVSTSSFNDIDGWRSGFNNTDMTAYSANKTSWITGGYNSFTLTAAALADMASQDMLQVCFMNYDFDYLDDGPYNCPPTFANGWIQQCGCYLYSGTSRDPKIDWAGPSS